jgi:hypothetical protein
MSHPVFVSIPHRLGKEEALARLKAGFSGARTQYSSILSVQEEIWSGDRLTFRVSSMGQVASGTIDVAEDHVRLEINLPWLLAKFAEKIVPTIRTQGTLLLEKK